MSPRYFMMMKLNASILLSFLEWTVKRTMDLAGILIVGLLKSIVGSDGAIRRNDGTIYFPGRGCGIGTKYTWVNSLPEDTSGLKCVFYKPKENNFVKKANGNFDILIHDPDSIFDSNSGSGFAEMFYRRSDSWWRTRPELN